MPTGWSAFPGMRCARPAGQRTCRPHLLISITTCSSPSPAEVIELIYEFLGEEPFAHDFDNVDYDAPDFDAQLGVDGLHTVHQKVEPRPRKTILPPDLFERYTNIAFWRDLGNSKAYRLVQQVAEN